MSDITYSSLKSQYTNLYPQDPVSTVTTAAMEKCLSITLPDDLKAISRFYSGGLLGGISHFEIAGASRADNVVEKTLEWRVSLCLPQAYIAIAEPAGSLIVLDVLKNNVLWLASVDAVRLGAGESFMSDFDCFESYKSFFAFLLKREIEEME